MSPCNHSQPAVCKSKLNHLRSSDRCKSCLVPRPRYSARPKRFRSWSRGPSEEVRVFPACLPRIRHRSELTDRAWENAIQGLDKYKRAYSHEKQRDVGVALKEKGGCWTFVWVTAIISAVNQSFAFLFSECRPLCSFQEFESAPCAGKTDRNCTGTFICVKCEIAPYGIASLGLCIWYTHLSPPPDASFMKMSTSKWNFWSL